MFKTIGEGREKMIECAENSMQNSSSHKLDILYVICLAMGILCTITDVKLIGAITSVVICLTAFYVTSEQYYIFIFGLQFLRNVIRVDFGSASYSFLLFVYLIFIIKVFFVHRKVTFTYFAIPLFFALDFAAGIRFSDFAIGDNLLWIISFAYMIFAFDNFVLKVNFEKLVIYFLLAEWSVCLINVFAELRVLGQTLIPSMYGVYNVFGDFCFGKAYPSVAGANGISFNNAIGIALCILMLPTAKKFAIKIFYVLTILFFAYTGCMLIERGFYVELAIFLLLYTMMSVKHPKRFLIIILGIGAVVAILYNGLYDYLENTILRVIERFIVGNGAREELFGEGTLLLQSNISILLFGAGTYYPNAFGFTAHNLFLDSLISLGIFGCIIYWFCILKTTIKSVLQYGKIGIQPLLPIIMLFAYKLISGSTRDVGFTYFVFLAAMYSVYYESKLQARQYEA